MKLIQLIILYTNRLVVEIISKVLPYLFLCLIWLGRDCDNGGRILNLIKNTLYYVGTQGQYRIAFIDGEMEFLIEEEWSRLIIHSHESF
jgi:hypothetical protein